MSLKTEYMQEVAKTFNLNNNNIGKKIDVESGVEQSESLDEGGFLNDDETTSKRRFPYVQLTSFDGGVVERVKIEKNKVALCGKTLTESYGEKTLKHFIAPMRCTRWHCPICGKKDGRKHNKRKLAVMNNLGGFNELKNYEGYEVVPTVPEEIRALIQSRKELNKMEAMTMRMAKKQFPGFLGSINFIHLTGDQDPGVFKPHFPFLVIRKKTNEKLKLSLEKINEIKEDWKNRIEKKFNIKLPAIDVHVRFFKGQYQLLHMIDYNTKLHPSAEDFKAIEGKEGLENFFIGMLYNFRTIRYSKGLIGATQLQEASDKDYNESLAGEKLIHCRPEIPITWAIFYMKYMHWDYEILGDHDLYRIKDEIWDKKQNKFIKIKKWGNI